MRKVLLLAAREYKAAVHTKGFVLGLLLAPVVMSGGFIAMGLMKDRVDIDDKRVAVIDQSGLLAGAIVEAADRRNSEEIFDPDTGEQVRPAYIIEVIPPAGGDPEAVRLELSDRVRRGDLHAFLDIDADVLHPPPEGARIAYHAENSLIDEVRRWISWPINNRLRKLRLGDAGIEEGEVPDLFSWAQIEGMGLFSRDDAGLVREARRSNELMAFAVPFALMMIMFMLAMMGAAPLLSAVMEEKAQRIAEVLLGSVTPFQFMLGKVVGGAGISLTGAAVYIAGGIMAIQRMGYSDFIPYHILPWFFAFLILNIVMMGTIFAALGSACRDAKDAQSVSFTAMLPLMIPMFLMIPVIREPAGTFATGVSMVPIFTPAVMVVRLSATATIPLWQPVVGLGLVLAFTTLVVWAGGRIFRVGILLQGQPPRLGAILRWAIRG
jgi:ABC-2 type transport system permease protein